MKSNRDLKLNILQHRTVCITSPQLFANTIGFQEHTSYVIEVYIIKTTKKSVPSYLRMLQLGKSNMHRNETNMHRTRVGYKIYNIEKARENLYGA